MLLKRLATNRWEDGYQLLVSRRIEAIADLRAAADYELSASEDEACIRCPTERDETDGLRQILSGHQVAIRLPETLRNQLGGFYPTYLLDRSEVVLASTPGIFLRPSSRSRASRHRAAAA